MARLLGPPDDMGGRTRRGRGTPTLWRYGPVELHFADPEDRLALVHVHAIDLPTRGGALQLAPWALDAHTTLSQATQALARAGILHTLQPFAAEPSAQLLITQADVQLLFTRDLATGTHVLGTLWRRP